MNIFNLNSLEKIIKKIYSSSFLTYLREKFQLKEIEFNSEISNDVEFYSKRNLIVGISGEIYKHKTTGPCLIPTYDINLLTKENVNYKEILDKQPTIQNVLLTAIAVKGPVHVCLETKEFSNLLMELTNNRQDFLDEMIEVARRTWKIIEQLMDWWNVKNSEIQLHFTHETKIDETIRNFSIDFCEKYIDFLLSYDKKSNNYRIGQRLKKFLKKGKKPEEIYRLRVVSTYFPGWWGDNTIKEHTIVENIFHDAQLFTKLYSKTTMVGLLPPKDLTFKKPEMDVGIPLYLGTEDKVKEGIEILKNTKFPKKNRFNCIIGNLLLFAVKKIEDFECIESCGRKEITCYNDCTECLDILEEFLYKISDIR